MYEEIAFRFLEHFAWITYAMDRIGANEDEMWDTEDGFFYDLLHFPNGDAMRLKIRSMVGLLPLCAATVFEPGALAHHPRILELIELFRKRHPEVVKQIAVTDGGFIGYGDRRLTAVCNKEKLERILGYMLDENEFLSPYGIRSLSKYHLDHPFVFHVGGTGIQSPVPAGRVEHRHVRRQLQLARPDLDAGERAHSTGLLNMYPFYGDDFKVECPTGSGKYMTLFEVAKEIGRRLSSIFSRDENGKRPVYGGTQKVPGRSALARLHPVLRILPR